MKKILAIIGGVAVIGMAVFLTLSQKVEGQPNPITNPFVQGAVVVQAYQGTNATNEGVTYQGRIWTNYIGGSGAAEVDTPIDTAGYKDISIQFRFRMSAASTDPISVMLARSNDKVAGKTNMEDFRYFSATAAGNATVTLCTNLGPNNVWGGHRWLYVRYITNSAATTAGVTNYTITVNMK